MDIRKLILKILHKKGEVKASEIVRATGLSRTYINRFFQQLKDEGQIILIGKANKARYLPASKRAIRTAKRAILEIHRILPNKELNEDVVLSDIKKTSGVLLNTAKNITDIFNYAFLEMLNNAIEHSHSKMIRTNVKREKNYICFDVIDKGVGVFNNIMQKRNLHSEIDAIQDLLKGKQSTTPQTHSGEGIFFTSKVADVLTICSHRKQLIFNNIISDIFIKDIKERVGTKVAFIINLSSKRRLDNIFKQYSNDSFQFSKTKVAVKLYKMDAEYISRSQARRILSGLDKFKIIILDFKNVDGIGQGFADEVFRVWKLRYPFIEIVPKNANENIQFMIKRALRPT